MSDSPTQRTLKLMRDRGYFCEIVEHWNSWSRQRKDLFGFVDVLCLGQDEIIGVQTTSYSNMTARVKKIAEHENLSPVRKAGIKLLVHGWKKNKSGRWECKEMDVS
jgi:hypothetical protein